MKTFTDSTGRSWDISVTVDTVKRVRDICKFDLTDIGGAMAKLGADPVLFGDVLFAVLKPQADERKVDPTALFKALDGDALEAATNALIEAAIDFFGRPRRSALRELKTRTDKAADLVIAKMMAKLPDPEQLANDLLAEMEKTQALRHPGTQALPPPSTTTPSAGSSPASSESIPDHSPSES